MMTISCQLNTIHGKPIEGIFVELKCVGHPQTCFEAYSDKLGMIDNWFNPIIRKVQPVPCTPSMQDSQWQMRFHLQPFFGDTFFPEIWNTILVPKGDDCHIVLEVDRNMYAVIRDGNLHGQPLRTHTVPVHGLNGPKAIHNPSGSGDVEIRVITLLPYEQFLELLRLTTEAPVRTKPLQLPC
jgi:hypothetical protein